MQGLGWRQRWDVLTPEAGRVQGWVQGLVQGAGQAQAASSLAWRRMWANRIGHWGWDRVATSVQVQDSMGWRLM